MAKQWAVTIVSDVTTAASVRTFSHREDALNFAGDCADVIDSQLWADCVVRTGDDIVDAINVFNDMIRRSVSVDFAGVFVGKVNNLK